MKTGLHRLRWLAPRWADRARLSISVLARAVSLLAVMPLFLGSTARSGEAWPHERVLRPLVCRADFPLAQVEPLLADLRRLQADLCADLKLPAAAEWIELYLFRDKAAYDRYLVRHFPNAPYRRALYIRSGGQGRVFAYRGPAFEVDVRHECTHALLHAALPLVPLWLDEGLAEYYELPPESRARGNPYLEGISLAIRRGSLPGLEDLEKKSALDDMGNAEYRAAWAWIHFMLHASPTTRDVLVQHLALLHRGLSPAPLSQELRGRVPQLGGRLVDHWGAWGR